MATAGGYVSFAHFLLYFTFAKTTPTVHLSTSHLVIIFVNSYDPDQVRPNDFEKNLQTTKCMKKITFIQCQIH